MRKEDATGVLASVQFINQLPRLDSLNPVRLPVMRNLGSIELLPTGYDQESRTFTLSSSILYDEHLSLEQAQTSINDLLSEFCFAADNGRSKSVAVAAMFTIFARGLLHQDSLVPCFLYLANAEGAGKTTLAACAVSPVHGIPKNEGFPSNNDELEKRLTANVSEGVSYIVYDNVKGHVNSDKLEAFLTTPVWKGRVLGLSRTISASNCTTVLMTGNGTTISPDLRRRTLISELVMEAERAEDRKFKKLLDVPGLIERRAQVLSAMWAVVRAWDEAGRPKASRGNASFQRWTDVIGGIVEFGGWGCPVEPAKIDNGGDTELDDMRELVLAMSDGREMGFRSVVDLCRSRGLFDGLIPQDDDDGLDPKKKSVLGKIFGRYHERLFSGMVRFIVAGKGHARRYIARHENKPLSGEAPCPSVEPPQGSQGVSGDLESTLAS